MDASVLVEYNRIKLPNELEEETKIYQGGCRDDYKTGSTRCNTRYTKYYLTEDNAEVEYLKVSKHLQNMDWIQQHRSDIDILNQYEKTNRLSNLYEKKSPYYIRLHLKFYVDAENELNKNLAEMLKKYLGNDNTVYSISISTDFIE